MAQPPIHRSSDLSQSLRKHRYIYTALSFFLGIVLTVCGLRFVQDRIYSFESLRFSRAVEGITNELTHRINIFTYGLGGANGVFVASESVEKDEFRLYVASRNLPVEFPGAKAFGFIQYVEREHLESFIEEQKKIRGPEYSIRTAGSQPNLFVTKYIEPEQYGENYRAIGFDIGSEPRRRAAAEQAMLTGVPTLTKRVTLVTDRSNRAGFLYLKPVYKNGMSHDTPETRRAAIEGWVFVPFIVDDTVIAANNSLMHGVRLEIFEGDSMSAENQIYSSRASEPSSYSPTLAFRLFRNSSLQSITPSVIGGQTWSFRITALPPFFLDNEDMLIWGTLLAGLLGSLVLASIVWIALTGRERKLDAILTETAIESEAAMRRYTTELLESRQRIQEQASNLVIQSEQLAATRDIAQNASQAKSQFLANMSHEIRTPMNAIIGMADSLLETSLSPQQLDYVQTMSEASGNLLTLINNILDISKIESGQLELESVPFCISEVIEKVIALFNLTANHKGLDLIVSIDPSLPRSLKGDPTRLRQVLVNLIGNAIKFTASGQVTLSIGHQPEGDNRHSVSISVEDTGIGMSAEQVVNLFQPFSQVDNSITRKYGGTGLGLSIAKQLVELMGGKLHVKSVPGEGSLFYFALQMQADLTPAKTVPHKQQVETKTDKTKALRILLVEDHDENRKVMMAYLRSLPYQIEIAENGAIAIDKFKKSSFDLILMDMQMPEMDGYTATKTIREWEKSKHLTHTPILALTAYALNSDREKSFACGCDEHLTKPIRKNTLLEAIHQFAKSSKSSVPAFTAHEEGKDPAIEALVPGYLRSRNKDIVLIEKSLQILDFSSIGVIGHKMRGASALYGFPELEQIGAILEEAATNEELETIECQLAALKNKLSELRLAYPQSGSTV